jgi:hypothetical protein
MRESSYEKKVSLDPVSGRFLPTPTGEKTEKMLQEELRLGVKFEDDYKEKIIEGDWGQKKFSHRWNIRNKALIFGKNQRGGRRSWIQILNLPSYPGSTESTPVGIVLKGCERCGITDITLEGAHWIWDKDGGPNTWYNIVDLCPNCHTLLDSGDINITEDVKEILLLRVTRKLLEKSDSIALRKDLLKYCKMIIERKVIK